MITMKADPAVQRTLLTLADVEAVLAQRTGQSGLEEKAARKR